MKYEAILFDLDGTLIHTTHLYADACIAAMEKMGLPFTLEDFNRLYPQGTSFRDWILERGGTESLVTHGRKVRDEAYEDLLRTHSSFLDGAEELLKFLADHPTGIITGSWRSYVHAIDEKLGVSKHVGTVITADDMEPYYKPHPHGLFLACDALGVDPEKCIYIGDQSFDVEAAKAAKMKAALIHGPHTPKNIEHDADHTLTSIAELQALIV